MFLIFTTMKIIHNKLIPFGSFGLINILGLLFTKVPVEKISDSVKRHEGTHTYQQYELVMISAIISLVLCNIFASWWYLVFLPIIPFITYALAFLIELAIPPYYNAKEFFAGKSRCEQIKAIWPWLKKVWIDAYYDNCFEREANANEHDPMYLAMRPFCAMFRYIIPRKERTE